jgi:hypothetical protein
MTLINNTILKFMAGPDLPSEEIICKGNCGLRDLRIQSSDDIVRAIIKIAELAVYVAVPIAILMVIFTGFMMLIGQIKNPLTAFLNIFIGLGIIIISFVLTDGFANVVRDAPNLLNSLLSNR